MVEAIKTIKTEDGFSLIHFGECPQLMNFAISTTNTFMYDGLCNNVELYHVQHEAYRNENTEFSVILNSIKEAIDQYCYPLKYDALPTECKECIWEVIESC